MTPLNDQQFKQLLDALGLSWRGYRKVRKGVKKRIARHMQAQGVRSISAYLALLKSDASAWKECQIRLTVSISRFFRDRRLWQTLETDILPEMCAQHPRHICVWSAGCSRGEEVYSFRIVWDRICQSLERIPQLRLVASDMVPAILEQAKAGVYSLSSLKDVPDEILERYFDKFPGKNRYTVIASLKEDIQWCLQDHLASPPTENFHIIFLRNNLLTYHLDPIKTQAFQKIYQRLTTGGWLIVGAHEKPPVNTPAISRHRFAPWAYRKLL